MTASLKDRESKAAHTQPRVGPPLQRGWHNFRPIDGLTLRILLRGGQLGLPWPIVRAGILTFSQNAEIQIPPLQQQASRTRPCSAELTAHWAEMLQWLEEHH